MYAIIATGGKQYKVSEGDTVKVELLKAEVGSKITLDVLALMTDDEVKAGKAVDGASVSAEVTAHGKGKKINIFTYKAKKNEKRKMGHRQPYTQVRIDSINA